MNTELGLKLISIFEACAIWGVLFIISYFAVVFFGLKKNIVLQLEENIKKLNQNLDLLLTYFSNDKNVDDNINIVTKALTSFLKKQKNTLKLAKIYSFDNPELIDALTFYEEMVKSRNCCQEMMFFFNKNEYDKIIGIVDKIKVSFTSSEILLKNLKKEEEKKKIKKF